MNRNEVLQEIVLDAEEGRVFIEMGREGPKISVVSRNWKSEWCLDEPDKSVPLIEELIPELETAGLGTPQVVQRGRHSPLEGRLCVKTDLGGKA